MRENVRDVCVDSLASCTALVCSSGKMAGCRNTKSMPHDTPKRIVEGDMMVNIVLTTTPMMNLMKKRVTAST